MDIKDWGRKIKSAEYGELYQRFENNWFYAIYAYLLYTRV